MHIFWYITAEKRDSINIPAEKGLKRGIERGGLYMPMRWLKSTIFSFTIIYYRIHRHYKYLTNIVPM